MKNPNDDIIKEFEELKKGNELIRKELNKFLSKINKLEREHILDLVNDLINNEIQQEKLCEQ